MREEPKRFVGTADVIREDNDWTHNERLLMVRARMDAGHCHPFHRHPHREEIIHVLAGRAEQWVGEEYRILGPGEVAVIPPGVPHATYNPFDEELVFHAILSPAKLEGAAADAADPEDVSSQAPWDTVREGMRPCRLLRDG